VKKFAKIIKVEHNFNWMKHFLFILSIVTIMSCSHIAEDITAFSINDVAGTITGISITVPLPAGTVVTSLAPTISVSDGATVSPSSGTPTDFTSPVIYTVTGSNKAKKQYVVMVTVATPSVTSLCDSTIDPSSKGFQAGDGSKEKPFVICNSQQLNLIGDTSSTTPNLFSKSYILGADIDMSGVTFNPIGNTNNPMHQGFIGIFDGNNKKISNLTFTYQGDSDAVGFICFINLGGLVKNLGLINVNITGTTTATGGLVGYANRGTILNSYVTGNVSGSGDVGGLVGQQDATTVSGCYTTGTVTGTEHVGGLVGVNYADGSITNSYSASNVTGSADNVGGLAGLSYASITTSMATGNVNGANYVGGLVGYNYELIHDCYATGTVIGSVDDVGGLAGHSEGQIEYSYATGTVTGTSGEDIGGLIGYNEGSAYHSYATGTVTGGDYAGGLVGYNNEDVRYSFATGTVTGVNYVGGLLGYNDTEGSVGYSYSIGAVSGTTHFGGLLGADNGFADNNYWNTETSGQSDPLTDPGATGETTATMTDPLSSIYDDWNFIRDWSFNEEECFSIPTPPFLPPYCCIRPFVDF